ncbi:TPA: archease [Candidatus Poribacteria bacterium]|nr:archease [Candidatus Poribacteria bacterium]
MRERYRFFDHTADLGVEIFGRSIEDLFQNALSTLIEIMVDVNTVEERRRIAIEISSDSTEELFIDMLREVIFQHEVEEIYFKRGEIKEFSSRSLKASLWGERIDYRKHLPIHHIKNVTYHGFQIKRLEDGIWCARVIFDV